MAIAKLIFDGVMERFPRLRFGFLEAGVGWFPDLIQSLHEHWEKRIKNFDPSIEPSIREILVEFAKEPVPNGGRGLGRKVRQLASILGPKSEGKSEERVSPEQLEAFRYEHPNLPRDPYEYVERGQIFLSFEPGDPAVAYLPIALGDVGRRLSFVAIDYGHWDAELVGCVQAVAGRPGIDPEYAKRLLSQNALEFYGPRLQQRIGVAPPIGSPIVPDTDGLIRHAS